MPLKRVDKNKKVVSERGTKQPTAGQLEAAKRKEIDEQNKQLDSLKPTNSKVLSPNDAGSVSDS